MNNENFAGEYHALLDRLKEQIDITSRFCEANVTFSGSTITVPTTKR